jgi:hypothetical protein
MSWDMWHWGWKFFFNSPFNFIRPSSSEQSKINAYQFTFLPDINECWHSPLSNFLCLLSIYPTCSVTNQNLWSPLLTKQNLSCSVCSYFFFSYWLNVLLCLVTSGGGSSSRWNRLVSRLPHSNGKWGNLLVSAWQNSHTNYLPIIYWALPATLEGRSE